MTQRDGKLGRVKRSTILTITMVVVMALFLPMVMGGISAWNDYIADHNGRNYHVRTAADLIIEDPVNESLDGDALFLSYEGTGDNLTYNPQTVIFGNETNIGYHTIVLEGVNDGTTAPYAVILFRLNCSTKNLRDNNTVSFSMDVYDWNGTVLNVTMWVQDAEAEMIWDSAPADELAQLGSGYDTVVPNTNATIEWETATVEFSYLDIISAEDDVGIDNYIVVAVMVETGEPDFAEGLECNFRIYDSSLNSFGTLNSEAGYRFTLFIIGVMLMMSAVLATPMVNIVGPGFSGAVKRDWNEYKAKKSPKRMRGRR